MLFGRNKYKIKETERQFLDYIPPVSIFLGGAIFIIGTISAIILYQTPNGGYQFFEQFFSELGIRNDYVETFADGSQEQRYAPDNPEIFNITLFASGFLMIPFFLFTFRQMRNHNRFSNLNLLLAMLCGILSGIFLIGSGIFDLSYQDSALWEIHGFWAANLYIMLTLTSIFWFIMLLFARHLPYKNAKWIFVDFVLLVILVILVLINILDGLQIINIDEFSIINTFPVQAYQKFIAYAFFSYYGLIVGVRLTKTKYDNTPVTGQEFQCPNCRTINPITAPFCTECGIKL